MDCGVLKEEESGGRDDDGVDCSLNKLTLHRKGRDPRGTEPLLRMTGCGLEERSCPFAVKSMGSDIS